MVLLRMGIMLNETEQPPADTQPETCKPLRCPSLGCEGKVEARASIWFDLDNQARAWVYGISDFIEFSCSDCGDELTGYVIEPPPAIYTVIEPLERKALTEFGIPDDARESGAWAS